MSPFSSPFLETQEENKGKNLYQNVLDFELHSVTVHFAEQHGFKRFAGQ